MHGLVRIPAPGVKGSVRDSSAWKSRSSASATGIRTRRINTNDVQSVRFMSTRRRATAAGTAYAFQQIPYGAWLDAAFMSPWLSRGETFAVAPDQEVERDLVLIPG